MNFTRDTIKIDTIILAENNFIKYQGKVIVKCENHVWINDELDDGNIHLVRYEWIYAIVDDSEDKKEEIIMSPQEIHAQFMAAAITAISKPFFIKGIYQIPSCKSIIDCSIKIADTALEEYQKRWQKKN